MTAEIDEAIEMIRTLSAAPARALEYARQNVPTAVPRIQAVCRRLAAELRLEAERLEALAGGEVN
jgi:response regulator RpfG family c-di-GMP phosphodiesterase